MKNKVRACLQHLCTQDGIELHLSLVNYSVFIGVSPYKLRSKRGDNNIHKYKHHSVNRIDKVHGYIVQHLTLGYFSGGKMLWKQHSIVSG